MDSATVPEYPSGDTRSAWVRLRTLVMLRWMAILGQIAAILAAYYIYDIALDLAMCFAAVGISVMSNLVAVIIFPVNKRISEFEALVTLLFDIAQLSFLLFLTGGINNPFALLMLAPVSISASALHRSTTIFLGLVAIALVTVLAFYYIPLHQFDGSELRIPPLLHFGFWLAIVIGIAFLGLYSRRVALEIHAMSEALLATQMALAREQKLTDLTGVVAAAAHELGTPLATIKLTSTEIIETLGQDGAASQDLIEDARLIHEQADRCRDILRSMGEAGKEDLHLRAAPISAVIEAAAEPHARRGKVLRTTTGPMPGGTPPEPHVARRPEIIHGLRNLIQNAVDFARSTVWIDTSWDDERIVVRITDDGPGYPPHLIGRIGDPFVRPRRGSETDARPHYEGMGLGLFIAKTLLERSGATLRFLNASDPFLDEDQRPERCGAIVEVSWPSAAILIDPTVPLGPNRPITS